MCGIICVPNYRSVQMLFYQRLLQRRNTDMVLASNCVYYTFVFLCVYLHLHFYVYIYICISMCVFTFVFLYMYLHLYSVTLNTTKYPPQM